MKMAIAWWGMLGMKRTLDISHNLWDQFSQYLKQNPTGLVLTN